MSTEPHTLTNPEPEKSLGVLLDQLIDVLLHRQPSFERWLDAVTTPIEKKHASGKVGEIIRLSFSAGLEGALAQRIVTAVVERDALGWPPEKIGEFVDAIYADVYKRTTNEERRRQGLPPLK